GGVRRLLLVRQCDAEARVLAGLGRDAYAPAGLGDEIAHHVHADAPRAAFANGGEAGAKDEAREFARVDVGRHFRCQHTLAHGFRANLLVIEPAAVVLNAELITIGPGARELYGDRAHLGLVEHHAVGGRLDAVANGV